MGAAEGRLGEEKHCALCGRRFGWRKRWAAKWATIRFCSVACSHRRLTATDAALERAILSLLRAGARGGSIGPGEAAQAVTEDWRRLQKRARNAARRLCARGLIDFVQRGRVVDASSAKGPVQLRLRS